jgi:hypothetical protein
VTTKPIADDVRGDAVIEGRDIFDWAEVADELYQAITGYFITGDTRRLDAALREYEASPVRHSDGPGAS